MNNFTFAIPTDIRFGKEQIQCLPAELAKLQVKGRRSINDPPLMSEQSLLPLYEGHAGHPVWPFLLRGFPDALQAPA